MKSTKKAKRTVAVNIRLTPEEHKRIETVATKEHRRLSDWVRHVCLTATLLGGCGGMNPGVAMSGDDSGSIADDGGAVKPVVDASPSADDALSTTMPDATPVVQDDAAPACGGMGQACCPIVMSDPKTACTGYNHCVTGLCQPCGGDGQNCCTGAICQGVGRCMADNGGTGRCTSETNCGTQFLRCCEGVLCGQGTCKPSGGTAPTCR